MQHDVSPSHILGSKADIEGTRPLRDQDLPVPRLRMLDHYHTVGPFRHYPARHDLGALAGTDRSFRQTARRDRLYNLERSLQILCPAGIAVHRRLVEGRHIHIGYDIGAQHPAAGFGQRYPLAFEPHRRFHHDPVGILELDHLVPLRFSRSFLTHAPYTSIPGVRCFRPSIGRQRTTHTPGDAPASLTISSTTASSSSSLVARLSIASFATGLPRTISARSTAPAAEGFGSPPVR